jgi:hypothetical protein
VPAARLLQQFITDLVGPEVVAQKLKASGSTMNQLELPEPSAAKSQPKRTSPTMNEKPAPRTPGPADTRQAMATPAPPSKRRPSQVGDMSALVPLDDELPRKPAAAMVAATERTLEPSPKRPPVALNAAGGAAGVLFVVVLVLLFKPQPEVETPKQYAKVTSPDEVQPSHHVDAVVPPVNELDAGGAVVAVQNPVVEPPRPTRGTLDVNCVPWCQIFIDGKDTGKQSPQMGMSLSAGKHHLKLVNPPTGIEREEEVVIRAGGSTQKIVKF